MQLGEQLLVLVLQSRGTIDECTADVDLQRAIHAAKCHDARPPAANLQIRLGALAASKTLGAGRVGPGEREGYGEPCDVTSLSLSLSRKKNYPSDAVDARLC